MNTQQLSKLFQHNLVLFLSELMEQFPEESDLALAHLFVSNHPDVSVLLDTFAENMVPHRAKILARDDQQVRGQNQICLEALPLQISAAKARHFLKVWNSERVSEETRTVIWDWLRSFVQLADKYLDARK